MFQFKIEAKDKTIVDNMNVPFNVLSDSTKRWAIKEVIYGCIRGLDGRILIASLECMPTVSMKYKKVSYLILVTGIMMETID